MILKTNKIFTSLYFQQIKSSSIQSVSINNSFSRFIDKQTLKVSENQGIFDMSQVKSQTNLETQNKITKLYKIQLRGDNQDFISQQDRLKSKQFFQFLQKLSQNTRICLITDIFKQFKRWFFIYGNVLFSQCIFKISYQKRLKNINLFANQQFYNNLKKQSLFQQGCKRVIILIYLSKKVAVKNQKTNQKIFVQQFLILFDKYLLKIQGKQSLNITQCDVFLEENLKYLEKTTKKSKFIKRTRSDSVWPFAKIQNCLHTSKLSVQRSQTTNFDDIISKKPDDDFFNHLNVKNQNKVKDQIQKQFKVKKATSFSHVYQNRDQVQNKESELYSSSNRKSALHIIKQEKSKQFFKSPSPKKFNTLKKISIQKTISKNEQSNKTFKFAYLKQKQKQKNVKQFRPISQPNVFTHIPEFLKGKKSPKKQNCQTQKNASFSFFSNKTNNLINQSDKLDIQSIQSKSKVSFSKFTPFIKSRQLLKQKFSSPRSDYSQKKGFSPLNQNKNQNKASKTGFCYKLKQTSTTLNTYSRTTNNIKNQSFSNTPNECSKFKNMSCNSLSLKLNIQENESIIQKKDNKKQFGSSSLQIKRIFSTITKKQPNPLKNIYKLELEAVKESKMSEDKTQRIAQISEQSKQISYNSKIDQLQIVQNELDDLFGSNQIDQNIHDKQIEGLQQQFQQLLK